MSLLETGKVVYNELLSVKIKSADKDETVTNLNFKIKIDLTPTHHQILVCDLTDPNDPFFLYHLILGEADFHALKVEQRLLVDFQQFPNQLVKLLREASKQNFGLLGLRAGHYSANNNIGSTTNNNNNNNNNVKSSFNSPSSRANGVNDNNNFSINENNLQSQSHNYDPQLQQLQTIGGASSSTNVPNNNNNNTSSSSNTVNNNNIYAVLHRTSGHEAVFSITESNAFRELQHIQLAFRRGNDSAVKEYLAAKLQDHINQVHDLTRKLAVAEREGETARAAEASVRQEAEQLRVRLATTEESLTADHSREVAQLLENHALSVATIQDKLNKEKSEMEKDLREQLNTRFAELEAVKGERSVLHDKNGSLQLSLEQVQEKLMTTQGVLKDAKTDIASLQESVKSLEATKFKNESEINRQNCLLSGLEQKILGAESNYQSQIALTNQVDDKQKNTESSLNDVKQRYRELQSQHDEAKKEINRGNTIILKLETQVKNLKAKAGAQRATLLSQEKIVGDLEKELHSKSKTEEVRKNEISDSHDRLMKLQQDNDELRARLNEAAQMIANNQSVIEYLNKQITERDLKSFAPLATINVPFGSSSHGASTQPLALPSTSSITRKTNTTTGITNTGNNHNVSTSTNNNSNLMGSTTTAAAAGNLNTNTNSSSIMNQFNNNNNNNNLNSTTGGGGTGKYHDLNRLRNLLEASGAPISGPVKYQMPRE